MNNSIMKCCICNNEKSGEFITINGKKYHLCCIEKLQNNWNELKKWLEEDNYKVFEEIWVNTQEVLDKMQELEQGKDE